MWRVEIQLTNNRYFDERKNSVEQPQQSKNFKIAMHRAIKINFETTNNLSNTDHGRRNAKFPEAFETD